MVPRSIFEVSDILEGFDIRIAFSCKNRPSQAIASTFHLSVMVFVCLHARSVQRHTWFLMGPDSNRMLMPGFRAYINMLALWSMEIIDRNSLK